VTEFGGGGQLPAGCAEALAAQRAATDPHDPSWVVVSDVQLTRDPLTGATAVLSTVAVSHATESV
jgi:hypothetical protein